MVLNESVLFPDLFCRFSVLMCFVLPHTSCLYSSLVFFCPKLILAKGTSVFVHFPLLLLFAPLSISVKEFSACHTILLQHVYSPLSLPVHCATVHTFVPWFLSFVT